MASLGLAQSAGSYVGAVPNSKAFIAVVLGEQGKALAYLCDSESIALWFRGKLEGGVLELRGADGQRLQGRVGSEVSGQITLPDGRVLGFSAPAASGEAGLYRYEGSQSGNAYVGGWIIDQKGEQRGAVIGGGALSPVVLSPKTLQAEHRLLGKLLAWLVTPQWVTQSN
ncbi:MAG: hypothetical protein C4333_14035 [Meiothermus sp.]